MPMIKIEDKEYDFDTLPSEAKQAMQRIQFADAEVARLNAQVAMFQIARNTYFQQLELAVTRVYQAGGAMKR